LFVKSDGPGYIIDPENSEISKSGANVMVKNIDTLNQYKDMPRLIFNPDGTGTFASVTP
jgi:hypothetical protein